MSHKSIKNFFQSLLYFLLFVFLTSCSSDVTIKEVTGTPILESSVTVETIETPTSSVPTIDPSGQEITFWHPWGFGDRAEVINKITDEFNSQNEWGITVESIYQGNYQEIENQVEQGVSSGELPNAVVALPSALARWHQLDVVIDLNPLINNPNYVASLSSVENVSPNLLRGAELVDGELVGWPFSQSVYVLFYNYTWGQELGFADPPQNTEEFMEQICAATEAKNDGTGGFVLFPNASAIMSWIFAFDGDVLNEGGNGYELSNEAVTEVAQFIYEIKDSGCSFETKSFPNEQFANRQALIVSSSSAGFPFQLEDMEFVSNDDTWGFIPFMGPSGQKSVNALGQYIGVVNDTPETNLATLLFVQYLADQISQFERVENSGYYSPQNIPLEGSTNTILVDGVELLEFAQTEPILSSWSIVRFVIGDAFKDLLNLDLPSGISDILNELNITANEIHALNNP